MTKDIKEKNIKAEKEKEGERRRKRERERPEGEVQLMPGSGQLQFWRSKDENWIVNGFKGALHLYLQYVIYLKIKP